MSRVDKNCLTTAPKRANTRLGRAWFYYDNLTELLRERVNIMNNELEKKEVTQISEVDTNSDTENQSELSKSELCAIADDVFGENTPPRKLWELLNDPKERRNSLYGLALRSGYTNVDKAAQWYVCQDTLSKTAKGIIGKMSQRGISRVCAYRIMSGFTMATVEDTLRKGMDYTEDMKVAVRAAEVAAKVLQPQANSIQLNIGVQVTQIGSTLDRMLADNPSSDDK